MYLVCIHWILSFKAQIFGRFALGTAVFENICSAGVNSDFWILIPTIPIPVPIEKFNSNSIPVPTRGWGHSVHFRFSANCILKMAGCRVNWTKRLALVARIRYIQGHFSQLGVQRQSEVTHCQSEVNNFVSGDSLILPSQSLVAPTEYCAVVTTSSGGQNGDSCP